MCVCVCHSDFNNTPLLKCHRLEHSASFACYRIGYMTFHKPALGEEKQMKQTSVITQSQTAVTQNKDTLLMNGISTALSPAEEKR